MPTVDVAPRTMLLLAVVAVGPLAIVGCPGDDEGSGETVGMTSAMSSGSATVTETSSSSASTSASASTSTNASAGTADTTSGGVDCADVEDEAACGAAQNLAEGGGCTWMEIFELSIEGDTCNFTPSGRGACVGTSGLDDGCNFGDLCESGNVEAYYAALDGDRWEMAQGQACRGITGFMQCTDTMDVPCNCACEIP